MKIGNIEIKGRLLLAPMAGYTDSVYRQIARKMGASLVYTEMISSKGLLTQNPKTWDYLKIDDAEHPVAVQIFGGNADDMASAARAIDHLDFDILDINMGCPVKKVVKTNAGSALLKDIPALEKMVRSVVNATTKPVSVKIRLGFDDKNYLAIAKAVERAGAKLLAVHGRTKAQGFKGEVDLKAIKEIKAAVKIAVAGNGDVKTVYDLERMLATGVDFVMIGRASLGNPWIFQEFNAYLNHKPYLKPTALEKLSMLSYHFLEEVKLKGERRAVLQMRSLAGFYVKGIPGAKDFKIAMTEVKDANSFMNVLSEFKKKVEMSCCPKE